MPGVDGKGTGGPSPTTPGASVDKSVRTDVPKGGSIKMEGPNAKHKGK